MATDPPTKIIPATANAARAIGRYRIYDEIAAGGMATVHLGRLHGPAGFTRTVAIKRLHPQFAKDQEFSEMFMDEARIAARIRHPNALTALDVVSAEGELYIVMDYIHGESLGRLLRAGPAPLPIAAAIVSQALLGLHAAHEALDDQGQPLAIVHRDVSPQNILVGVDGVSRVVDFGIAKAASRVHTTEAGTVKGKVAYMSPQQVQSENVDRRADIFATGVVLWEAIVGRKLLSCGAGTAGTIARVMSWRGLEGTDLRVVPLPLQGTLQRALARDPMERFATAREMALAIAQEVPCASSIQVGEWVEQRAAEILELRARAVSEVERQILDRDPLPLLREAEPATTVGDITRSALSASSRGALEYPAGGRRRNVILLVLGMVLSAALIWAAFGPAHSGARTEVASAPTESPARRPPQVTPTVNAQAAQLEPIAVALDSLPLLAPVAPASAVKRQRPEAPRRAPANAVNCTPRFNIDERGIKHFKPECFE